MKKIGLIVNPIAGLGGRVGLKGSDSKEIQVRALELGAVPNSAARATQAMETLRALKADFELLTYPGEMGDEAAREAGIQPQVIGSIRTGNTNNEDTIQAARQMLLKEVDLILFAGGDGTARDIYNAIGTQVPALGIPAGVKIQSAVYATHPRNAGEVAAAFLHDEADLRLAEVVDLDEEAFREGRLSASLYGFLTIPWLQRYVQGVKTPNSNSEPAALKGIAKELAERLAPDRLHIFGPGSSTQMVAAQLGIEKTLLGVDAVLDGKIAAADASEADLLRLLAENAQAEIIVTPIGGQGCIFGRGNQPISPEVIKRVGKKHIHVISTAEKIQQLNGAPLWVDTGDSAVDDLLEGYYEVITGFKESVMYKVNG